MFKVRPPIPKVATIANKAVFLEYVANHKDQLNRVPVGIHNDMIMLETDATTSAASAVLYADGNVGDRVEFPRHMHFGGETTYCLHGTYGEYLEPGEDIDTMFDGVPNYAEFQSRHPGLIELGPSIDGRTSVKFNPGAVWSMDEYSEHKPFGYIGEEGYLAAVIYWGGANAVTEPQKQFASAAVLAFDGCSEQTTMTPLQLIERANDVLKGQNKAMKCDIVALESKNVTMQMGTGLIASQTIAGDQLYDLLVIPGGIIKDDVIKHAGLKQFIKRHVDSGSLVYAVDTGVLLLDAAEVIGEREITASVNISQHLIEKGVKVRQPRPMWLGSPDKGIWTAAGESTVCASMVAVLLHCFGEFLGLSFALSYDSLSSIGPALYNLRGPNLHEVDVKESLVSSR